MTYRTRKEIEEEMKANPTAYSPELVTIIQLLIDIRDRLDSLVFLRR